MFTAASSTEGAYHTCFAPPPPPVSPGGTATIPTDAASVAVGDQVAENLRSQVRVLEDEVRLLRGAVGESLRRANTATTSATTGGGDADSVVPSSDYYYTSAAAIAARRRAQLAQLRERTEQLKEARHHSPAQGRPPRGRESAGSTQRGRSAPNSGRLQGRFVAPVEMVMVPTSPRRVGGGGEVPEAACEVGGEGLTQRVHRDDCLSSSSSPAAVPKPEIAFGRRVVPTTARPTSARSALGDIPLQGEGRGGSIVPTPSAACQGPLPPHTGADELYLGASSRPNANGTGTIDAIHATPPPPPAPPAATTYVGDSRIAVVSPLTVPPVTSSTAAVEADALSTEMTRLTRTVGLLQRALAERDALLRRLAQDMARPLSAPPRLSTAPQRPGPPYLSRSAEATAGSEAMLVVLVEELQRVRESLLAAQQQLLMRDQQCAQSQLALTRRNEELAALRAQLPSPAAAPSDAPPATAHLPVTTAVPGIPQPPPQLPQPVNVNLVPLMNASVRTLDSNVGPGAAAVSTGDGGSLAAAQTSGAQGLSTVNHTASNSSTATPQVVSLSLPVMTSASIVPQVDMLAQTQRSPVPLVSVPAPPPATTSPTAASVEDLQRKLNAATRKLAAWETWFQSRTQSESQPPPRRASGTQDAVIRRGELEGERPPYYYSAYTVERGERMRPSAEMGTVQSTAHVRGTSSARERTDATVSSTVLSQANWDLWEDVRETVVRDRVLRELAARERELAEERLAKAVQGRHESLEEDGGRIATEQAERVSANTPSPPEARAETVD